MQNSLILQRVVDGRALNSRLTRVGVWQKSVNFGTLVVQKGTDVVRNLSADGAD
jgi:hypothetical protein